MRSRVTATRSIAVASVVGALIAATVAIAALHAPADAQPASLAPVETTQLSLGEIMTTVSNGRDQMPAFRRANKPEELHDVAAYILVAIKKP